LPALLLGLLCPALVFGQEPSGVPSPDEPPEIAHIAACDQHGASTLFRCLWSDVRHLARRDSARWLAAGGALAAGSLLLDDAVERGWQNDRHESLVQFGEHLGEAGLHFGAPAALYAVARMTSHPDAAALGITLVRAQLVNAVLTRSLKIIPRARPYQEHGTLGKGSFPSGHASATFASATVIARRFGWRGGVPAFAAAALVGATRVRTVHYLSDVTFGAALGIASGLAVNMPVRRATVSPLVGPGVTGVTLAIAGAP
jgi:membrane-associated phospholipid phosphatase